MDLSHLSALALFAFVTTFTPGPNNIMLMTSGANVGFTRSLPHMLGVTLGFALMVLLVGIGLTGVFIRYPMVHSALNTVSLLYLVYLAYKIATSQPANSNADYQPMSFFSAVLFQWVNPKGWTMALTAVSVYNPSSSWVSLMIISLVFLLANFPSASVWVIAGQRLQNFLTTPKRVRGFNYFMALLLLASTLPMIQ